MFERFSDRARRVVVLAQEQARMLNHSYIGTEHFLLALLQERVGVGAQALGEFGITVEQTRADVEEIVGRGEGVQSGHIPFTPRAKKTLEIALRESLQLGHNYIGTEHILLGLLHDEESVAFQILAKRGVELSAIRQSVIGLLGRMGTEGPPAEAAMTPRVPLGGMPFSHEAVRVVEEAERVAERLGDRRLLPQHLLWGLIVDADDDVMSILEGLGVDVEEARRLGSDLGPSEAEG